MADTIDELLEQRLRDGVQSVSADGVSVTSMSVNDQIRLSEYLAAKTSATRNHLGYRLRKVEFGGCG